VESFAATPVRKPFKNGISRKIRKNLEEKTRRELLLSEKAIIASQKVLC
jgi:hypothetical protein